MTALAMDVRELSVGEIDDVAGGPFPLIPIVVAGIAAIAGVVAATSTDDCTTVTSTTTTGNTTTTVSHTECT